ncbi:MAG: 1-acyl-sn-glycerol-3-phosphate acyltransferase [Luminiphilus sp.]|nr:1-acyl-sn-glycerol-3-phosphate acyltransferase [Luminiphilus sp.]
MIDPQFEHYLREQPRLSYASSDQPWVTRQVTRSIERALGRGRLEEHYFALKARKLRPQTFFQEALLRSGIELHADFSPLEQIDVGRPLLFLANHPFGIVDGLVMCNLALRVASNFRVVINSLLCQDRDLAQHFLPIDFSRSREAERRNVRTKQLAGESLKEGVPLILFPSGTVSTANRMGFGAVKESPWTTFAAKLILQHTPTVVPVYFPGRNSRSFHVASHVAEPLRLAMLMREALRRFNSTVRVNIGTPVMPEDYQHLGNRHQLTNFFYDRVQAVGQSAQSKDAD